MSEQQIQIYQSQPSDNENHMQFDQKLRTYMHYGLTVFGRQVDLNYYHSITSTGYNNGAIYLAKRNQIIVGRVFLGVKYVYFQGKKQYICYMIDLQALNNELSIYLNLINHVISVSKEQFKSSLVYLAQRNNFMHTNCMDALNQNKFQSLSERIICVNTSFISDEPVIVHKIINNRNVIYCQLNERNLIVDYINKIYEEKDLFVEKEDLISQILYNQNFKGCFIVETEEKNKIIAGICFFADRRMHSNTLIRFMGIGFKRLSHQYFYLVANSIFSFLVLTFMLLMIKYVQIPYYYSIIGTLILYMIVFIIIDKYVQWIQIQTKQILRVFSPFFVGPPEYENQMFKFLLQNIIKEEVVQDSLMIIANLDSENQFLKHFKNQNGFKQQKVQAKYLYKSLESEEEDYNLSVYSFFDPRDI